MSLRAPDGRVFSWNDASGRVLEKVDFQREGQLRSHHKKDGSFVDVLYYGLLHDDIVESSEPSDFRA